MAKLTDQMAMVTIGRGQHGMAVHNTRKTFIPLGKKGKVTVSDGESGKNNWVIRHDLNIKPTDKKGVLTVDYGLTRDKADYVALAYAVIVLADAVR